jgi:hypothetical protein
MTHICRLCRREVIRDWLDFGPQALRNRFLHTATESEFTHPLALGCCPSCGTVQLADPPPVDQLRPRFGWISYNEPEGHLDDLAARLTRLPGLSRDSTVAGLTYKDDSTLDRLKRLGFTRTWRPDPRSDLGLTAAAVGIESIQATLTPLAARRLAAKFGPPDVLLVRHVLEHTHHTGAALQWATQLVRPGGYVVVEVPDATRALDRLDYTTVWEEHVVYFTPFTLRRSLSAAGFEVVTLHAYPYTLENSLVVIARPGGVAVDSPPVPREELARAARFVREFPRVRERFQQQLRHRGRIAMLGAGHLTGAFVNLYGLADRIDCVVDDNPNKQGLFMPGSRLPIVPSSELVKRGIDLCLMTVRPEIEDAVAAKNAAFTARGGVLASVFPDSPYALDRLATVRGAVA